MDLFGRSLPDDIAQIYTKIIDSCNCTIYLSQSNRGSSTEKIGRNKYSIHIDTTIGDKYFYEILLHEHIHVLQYMEGYKDIMCTSSKDTLLYINNAIMDIDVNRRLEQHYDFHDFSQERNNQFCVGLIGFINNVFNKDNILKSDIHKIAVSCAYSYFFNNKEISKTVIEYATTKDESIREYYDDFISIVENHPLIEYTHVREIQIEAARLFGYRHIKFVQSV